MIIIPATYQCEICGTRSDNIEKIQKCEARESIVYPIGLVFGNHSPDDIYKDITFCVGSIVDRPHSHVVDSKLWACRDNGLGDDLYKSYCMSPNELKVNVFNNNLNYRHPTFQRMIDYLEKVEIQPLLWNNKLNEVVYYGR